jgi:formamidopyrimidine-DNA glycosylase
VGRSVDGFNRPGVLIRANIRQDEWVIPIQNADEIQQFLTQHLVGTSIQQVQVLAPNALKTFEPPTEAFADHPVTATACTERDLVLSTPHGTIHIDLQRTGGVRWLEAAEPWVAGNRGILPTVRLLLSDGSAFDLTEPNKTKRIMIALKLRGRE